MRFTNEWVVSSLVYIYTYMTENCSTKIRPDVWLLYRFFVQCVVVAPKVVPINIHANIDSNATAGKRITLPAWIGCLCELLGVDAETDTQDDGAEGYTNQWCRL